MSKTYLKLNDVTPYKRAFPLSNRVWTIVIRWDHFAKDTIGKQWVRSIDSISANLAEGFGRYTRKDKAKFYYYAQGSVKESLDWLLKAKIRNLITTDEYDELFSDLSSLPKEINQLIKLTFEQLSR